MGNEVKLTAGALVCNTELLSFRPQVYDSDLLDFFGLSGATGTYNKATGSGFGFQWKQKVDKGNPFLSFDASYISARGFADSSIGAFSEDSGINVTTQLGARGQNWGATATWLLACRRYQPSLVNPLTACLLARSGSPRALAGCPLFRPAMALQT